MAMLKPEIIIESKRISLLKSVVFVAVAAASINISLPHTKAFAESGIQTTKELRQARTRPTLTPQEAAQLDPSTYILLDVRSNSEWWLGHIAGAKHLPVGDIAKKSDAELEALLPNKNVPIVTYCAAGTRAGLAVEVLQSKGYGAIAVTNGGYKQLKAEGLKAEF